MSKIKSDGGSSDYYKLEIVNRKTRETFSCEMGDIIYSVYGNDFDMGNIAKAMRRIHCDRNGVGKEGADSLYDANKVAWFAETLQQVARFEHCATTEKELAPSVFRSHEYDEWLPWTGGECPVTRDTKVVVKFRGEHEALPAVKPANYWEWSWCTGESAAEIVAYKIVKD